MQWSIFGLDSSEDVYDTETCGIYRVSHDEILKYYQGMFHVRFLCRRGRTNSRTPSRLYRREYIIAFDHIIKNIIQFYMI